MILIAESGSTKTEWGILFSGGDQRIRTQGISPYFHNTERIIEILKDELFLPAFAEILGLVTEINYYGTGCTAPASNKIVNDALEVLFPNAAINITYDLVASAHALCGNEKGIACILGTGSNSGYFNGKEIERNIPGLGFILGDEGSGAYLGKLLSCEYLYGKLDEKLIRDFEKAFNVDVDSLLHKVYAPGLANRLLASFAEFYSRHRGHLQVESLLRKGLGDFFAVHIAEYEQCRSVPVHFSGSIAWYFREVIEELCIEYKFECGNIIREPMDGLVEYYSAKV